MSPTELLDTLHSAGAAVAVDGDDLVITIARGTLSPGLRVAIAAAKTDLLIELKKSSVNGSDAIDRIDRKSVDADTLRWDLDLLHLAIRRGCLMGLHRHLERVAVEVVRSALATTGPETPEAETIRAFRHAGEVATLLALVQEYRRRLALLQAAGHDVFREAAALDLCLSHPSAHDEEAS